MKLEFYILKNKNNNKMSKLIITDESEHFTPSNCDCVFCDTTNQSILNWNKFIPKNSMEARMKDVIDRIEQRENKRHQKRSRQQPQENKRPLKLRRSPRLNPMSAPQCIESIA